MKYKSFMVFNLLLIFNLNTASVRRRVCCKMNPILTAVMAQRSYVPASIVENNSELKNVVYCLPCELNGCKNQGFTCKIVNSNPKLWKVFSAWVAWRTMEQERKNKKFSELFDLKSELCNPKREKYLGLYAPVHAEHDVENVIDYLHVCNLSEIGSGLQEADCFDLISMGYQFQELYEILCNSKHKAPVDIKVIRTSADNYFGKHLLPHQVLHANFVPKNDTGEACPAIICPELLDPLKYFEQYKEEFLR